MEGIEQALAATSMFRDLTPEQIKAVADLGEDVEFPDGRALMMEGGPADSFFLIRDGFVALQTQSLAGPITIETLHNGDPVGWSWLVEPYLSTSTPARAASPGRFASTPRRCACAARRTPSWAIS